MDLKTHHKSARAQFSYELDIDNDDITNAWCRIKFTTLKSL